MLRRGMIDLRAKKRKKRSPHYLKCLSLFQGKKGKLGNRPRQSKREETLIAKLNFLLEDAPLLLLNVCLSQQASR